MGQSSDKCSHDGNGIANVKGKKQKRKVSKNATNSGGKLKGKASGKPFCLKDEKAWLIGKKLCLHCCQLGHLTFNCMSKDIDGEPAAPMPAGFATSAKV